MPSASKPRARLSVVQVLTIFQAKGSASTAAKLGAVYSVSEKAVRDIWSGRTWSRETWNSDSSGPLQLKRVGRPIGCKDKQPRKKRVNCHDELAASTNLKGVEVAFRQDILQMPPSQQASRLFGIRQGAVLVECIDDSAAWHRSTATWQAHSTPCHPSVDGQLHEWDAFWRFSFGADPFCGDWKPC